MYNELEALIVRMGMSKEELAKELDIGYNTLLLKLKGKNKFTLDEAIKIKNILNSNITIEQLFGRPTA